MSETTPSVGLYVGCMLATVAVVFVVIAVVATLHFSFAGRRWLGWSPGALWCLAIGLVVGAGTLVSMWPLKYDYHSWAPKSGVVSEVNKRLVSDNDHGVQEAYLITVDGNLYSVNEARGGGVKPGDRIRLKCKKAYQWGSPNHGWDCKWGQLERNGKVVA